MTAGQKVKRKLKAILSADVKGYSILMADDEIHTVKKLNEYRDSMSDIIKSHSGRVVDAVGDNLLAEFSSAVDAVQCSVEIQRDLKQKNEKLTEDRRLEFRIGINIGDVIHEEDRIYGSGVNVAARIEGLAEPGGVCISRNVYNHSKDKLKLGYEYFGEHTVKNIKDPVRVYKILMAPEDAGKLIGEEQKSLLKTLAWSAVIVASIILIAYLFFQKPAAPEFEPASIEKMAFELPEKPSIAVLPFDNMSGDPEQEYFSDGITEDIITTLSKTDLLFVIARNSTFTYKGKPVKVKQVAEELGVRYVLEGSVRRTEDRVRITAQLIDAVAGHHLWAERYDRELKDIFALQDEITLKIVTELQVKLTGGERARIWSKRYKNLDIKLKAMELMPLWRKGTDESRMQFGQVAQELIDMASESELGYTSLGWYYWSTALRGKSPQESIEKAFKLAQKSLSLDESNPSTYGLLSNLYGLIRQYDKAIAAGEQGIALNPNGAHNHCALGIVLSFAGKFDEAIVHFKQAIRLNPFPEYYYFTHLGRCYMHKGQYEEALTATKKAIHVLPDSVYNNMLLAAIYALLDRQEEASAAVKKVLEIKPDFSVAIILKAWAYKNKADLKLLADAMHKAGLPD